MSGPPTPEDGAVAMGLAARLRADTRSLHTHAERAGIMPALLRGELPRPTYVRLLENLLAIYRPLEQALTRHAQHPGVAPIVQPALFRQSALAADLQYLGAGFATPRPAPCAAARRYADRLEYLSAHRPQGLVAHAYTRYLGDLSGGQVLGRIVAQTHGLVPGGEGTRFYQFGSAQAVVALAQGFRAGLDALATDRATQDTLVAEAQWAFQQHTELFESLALPP